MPDLIAMDNVCHTLTGAALGYAGLASRTRFGMATLLVASNLPDVDVAVFATDTLAMSFRRGWTHGILAQLMLPLALAAIMWAIARARPATTTAHPSPAPNPSHLPHLHPSHLPHPLNRQHPVFPQLLLLSYVGLYSHIYLDYLNSYGIRLLMPFSERWFYGDALFVVDPLMYLALGAGVWLARRRARGAAIGSTRAARVALAVAGLYTVAMLASNLWARAVVREGLVRAGRPSDTRFMVTPVLANPFRREVIVDLGERYEKGFVWFAPWPRFRPAGYGVNRGLSSADAHAALATPRAQAYLRWSRFPFLVQDRMVAPPRHVLNDYRYSGSGLDGWAAMAVRPD
jgi:inner membrane protein